MLRLRNNLVEKWLEFVHIGFSGYRSGFGLQFMTYLYHGLLGFHDSGNVECAYWVPLGCV